MILVFSYYLIKVEYQKKPLLLGPENQTRQKIVKVQCCKSINGTQAYKCYNGWFFFGIWGGGHFNKDLTREYNLKREVHIF